MTLLLDSREFIASLNAADVEYVIIDGHALAFHGLPRSTGDLDFFVRLSPANAEKLCRVLGEFGFASLGCKPDDFLKPGNVVQLGYVPNRIDILTSIDGVTFDEAWRDRLQVTLDHIPVNVISRAHLIANKRATGRPRDLDDIERLGGR